MKGYASSFVDEINASSASTLGVLLGKACVKRNIPVTDVSEFFRVSRTTVYSWFRGTHEVDEKHREKMQKLVDKLK